MTQLNFFCPSQQILLMLFKEGHSIENQIFSSRRKIEYSGFLQFVSNVLNKHSVKSLIF